MNAEPTCCRSSWLLIFAGAALVLSACPVIAGLAPQGATTQIKAARPGERYRGSIALRNTGTQPADVKIYRTDFFFTADGRTDYGAPGQLPRSNAAWVRLNQEQITVTANGSASVEYEVRVPDDARLAGTYWSTLMIEQVSGAEATQAHRRQPQLRQIVRHAIQVITEIDAADPASRSNTAIAFDNAHLIDAEGKRWLSVDVKNTGERWLRTALWLELHDSQGKPVGKFLGHRLRTFPATSVRGRIDLSGVTPGRYLALLVADAGGDNLFGAHIELDIPPR